MYKINFSSPIHVHFIGIGGISMSGLAEILMNNNFEVSGSDMNLTGITAHLTDLGAKIFRGHDASNISDDIDLVVYTAAIKSDNPEYQEAIRKNIPLMDRAQLLGQIMDNYSRSIGVAGTHGKTTTTSMISQILLASGKDPTISVGGILDIIRGNIRVGNSPYFVAEACEYTNSFHKFYPYIALVLNIEEDHLDFFKDINDIRMSFNRYIKNVPKDGYVIINTDIDNYEEVVKDVECTVITYGSDKTKSDWSAEEISFDSEGHVHFDLLYKGEFKSHIHSRTTGIHNVYNAVCALATADILGIGLEDASKALSKFETPKRRFEHKGSLKGVQIYDDYAHHPTEITATLNAAKKVPHEKLWVVFQPHTYSRTKSFLEDFAKALSIADGVILADIYSAREKDPGDIHSKDLMNCINNLGGNCYYFSSFDEIEIFILEHCLPNDMLITMGAGNIHIVGEDLLNG